MRMPFVETFEGMFGDVVMVQDGEYTRHFKAPLLADLPNCPFGCVFVQVNANVKIFVTEGNQGDSFEIVLRKGVDPEDVVARSCFTLQSIVNPEGPHITQTMSIVDIVKLNPGEYLDLHAEIVEDLNQNFKVELVTGSENTHVSFKIGGFDPVMPV